MGIFYKRDVVHRSRQLENRSFLKFVFPQGGETKPVIFDLPFYENIFISESQHANLARYQPVGRPGSMFAHTGAKSRKLGLTFSITLPHIQFDGVAINLDRFLSSVLMETKEQKRARFVSNQDLAADQARGLKTDVKPKTGRGDTDVTEKVLLNVRNGVTRFFGADAIESFGESKSDRRAIARKHKSDLESGKIKSDPYNDQDLLDIAADSNFERDKFHTHFTNLTAMTVVYWWVNMIRASVLSHSKKPVLGPPIVRLTHGLLYDNIPCVATSYNVEIDDDAGYELKTLMPRRINFNMALEEVRVGDLGDFSPGVIVEQDNVVGYEAILEHGTMDPMRIYGNIYE